MLFCLQSVEHLRVYMRCEMVHGIKFLELFLSVMIPIPPCFLRLPLLLAKIMLNDGYHLCVQVSQDQISAIIEMECGTLRSFAAMCHYTATFVYQFVVEYLWRAIGRKAQCFNKQILNTTYILKRCRYLVFCY